MKNLNVSINDFDYAKLGFSTDPISFDELREKLTLEYAKDALIRCNQIAQSTGLSNLSLDDINAEINAVRNAKNRH